MTLALRQLATSTSSVTAFTAATSVENLSRAVSDTTVPGPSIPTSIVSASHNFNNASGASTSWLASNIGLFAVLVTIIPVVILVACGTGYFVYSRRRRLADQYKMDVPEESALTGGSAGGCAAAAAILNVGYDAEVTMARSLACGSDDASSRRLSGISSLPENREVPLLPYPPTAMVAAAASNRRRIRTSYNALYEGDTDPTTRPAAGNSVIAALARIRHYDSGAGNMQPGGDGGGTGASLSSSPYDGLGAITPPGGGTRDGPDEVITHYANVLYDMASPGADHKQQPSPQPVGGGGLTASAGGRSEGGDSVEASLPPPPLLRRKRRAMGSLANALSAAAPGSAAAAAVTHLISSASRGATRRIPGPPPHVRITPRPRAPSSLIAEFGWPADRGGGGGGSDHQAGGGRGSGGRRSAQQAVSLAPVSAGRARLDPDMVEMAWQVESSAASNDDCDPLLHARQSIASVGAPQVTPRASASMEFVTPHLSFTSVHGRSRRNTAYDTARGSIGVHPAPGVAAVLAATGDGGAPDGPTDVGDNGSSSACAPRPAPHSTRAAAAAVVVVPPPSVEPSAPLPPLPPPPVPGLGGGGYLSLATASGRLPAIPLEPSYSARSRQQDSATAGTETGIVVDGEGDDTDAEGPDLTAVRIGPHLNPLYEPAALYLNPLLNETQAGRGKGASWARPVTRRH